MSGRFKIPFLTPPAESDVAAPVEMRAPPPPKEPEPAPERSALLDERVKIHNKLIDEFNLSFLDKMARDDLRKHVASFVRNYVLSEYIPMNQGELDQFVEEIIDEMVGLGPIEPLLKDPTVNDILINTHRNVYVERFGVLDATNVRFKDEAHLLRIINKIVSAVGRRIDESSPMVDARLEDGSRFNAAIRPIALDGPLVSIRKFSKRPYSFARLVEVGALHAQMVEILQAAVSAKLSIIISGGTGTGKTTFLNALSSFISPKDRIVTIEDAAELQLQQPHVARLETRPPNAEGKGEIRQRELLKNALRMRPDRIVVGECRGEEAFDMLQAMNTGHEGSMTTIHANTPRDGLSRLEQMIGMAGTGASMQSIRQQIASAVQIIIQLQRLSDGSRRVISISEITGMEGDVIQMQEIYRFVRESVDDDGKIRGSFRPTGIRPAFLAHLKHMGIDFPASYFDPSVRL